MTSKSHDIFHNKIQNSDKRKFRKRKNKEDNYVDNFSFIAKVILAGIVALWKRVILFEFFFIYDTFLDFISHPLTCFIVSLNLMTAPWI